MKKLLAILTICLVGCAPMVACASDRAPTVPEPSNEITVCAFDDYYDLQKIMWNNIIGSVSLEETPAYVLSGKSAKLHIDYTDDAPFDYTDNSGDKWYSHNVRPQIVFDTRLYDTKVSNTDYIDGFRIGVFNANERAVDLVFVAYDDSKKVLFTDGRTLQPNVWNRLGFDVKSYFYPDGKGISQYALYVIDDAAYVADALTLYFDECTITTATDRVAPSKTFAADEILSFAAPNDLAYVLTTTKTGGIPAFGVDWSGRTVFGTQKGALHATFRNGIGNQYEVDASNNGYDIKLLDAVAARAQGAISIDCRNESAGDVQVRLIAESGTQTVEATAVLTANETETLTLDVSGLGGVTALTVRIDNRNLLGKYDVYFANLKMIR